MDKPRRARRNRVIVVHKCGGPAHTSHPTSPRERRSEGSFLFDELIPGVGMMTMGLLIFICKSTLGLFKLGIAVLFTLVSSRK